MNIGFDIDGVLLDIKNKHKKIVEQAEENGMVELIAEFLQTEFWKNYTLTLQPMKDIQILRYICNNNKYNVHLISRRLQDDMPIIIEWLNEHDINIKEENIHLREDLYTSAIAHKFNMIQKFNIIHFWDDDEKIIENINKMGDKKQICLVFKNWQGVNDLLKTKRMIQ